MGSTAYSLIHFKDGTPAAPAGDQNVTWQQSAPYPSTAMVNGVSVPVEAIDVSAYVPQSLTNGSFGITIDGGGSTPATGSKGFVQAPFDCTITGWTMLGDQSGSAQVTIKKSTYAGFPTTASIVASAPPVLSAAQKNTSTTLTGWTVAVALGDVLEFNLDSVATITRIYLKLQVTRSD